MHTAKQRGKATIFFSQEKPFIKGVGQEAQHCKTNTQKINKKKFFLRYSTQYSHVVTDRSTDWAVTSLTLEIGRDPVLSGAYGRNIDIYVVRNVFDVGEKGNIQHGIWQRARVFSAKCWD